MNLLSHALLSDPDPEARLGNLLADFVRGNELASMPPRFLEGVRIHRAIDAFTDSHPLVHRSTARLGEYRYVRGILVDVFYDHFLTLNWGDYSDEPLGAFTARIYAEIRSCPLALPPVARSVLDHLIEENWLGSYGSIAGIEDAFGRISERLSARVGREFSLAEASKDLAANFGDLSDDFAEFFPLLREHFRSCGRIDSGVKPWVS